MSFEVGHYDFAAAGEAASKIKQVLRKLGMAPDVVRRAAVAAYEAEMNLVIHSVGGSILLHVDTEKVTLVSCDEGPGMPDISLAMKEGYSTAPDEIREMGFGAGMGLPNMKRCSDSFSIESEVGRGTTVTASIRIA
ncbi:MAG: ATP-binding protein [Firmicutes bacterium]|nr:ATP-binding protein [Bacillota bacterium]MDD4336992.1 ATP-binding protein [Bacillota bacterium]MDD4791492.1 ATP-binding protein [Bacillota bacterium]